ncbi:MAG: hypothetical protein CMM00_06715 [Rhodopirellula sp.]|nr:hypothetical protein [Rhodopirellula sp.]
MAILERILAATRAGKLTWVDDVNDWRKTGIGNDSSISYRFRYIEAPPQVGADPYMLEMMMPGLNAGFFIGTEGYALLFDIHVASTGGVPGDTQFAEDFLDRYDL